jgi:membrane protease subunit HflK
MRYLLVFVVLAFVGSLVTGMTQVRPDERVVVRRFGKVVATPGPGLWVGLPWGFDRIDRVSVDQVRRVVVGYQPDQDDGSQAAPPGQLITGDHNLVNIQVVVHYAVDENQVVSFFEQADRADGLIARAAETVLTEWVAGRTIDDVLLQGKVVLSGPPRTDEDGHGVVATRTAKRLEPYQLGIRLLNAEVAYLYPPQEVKHAFDEVTKAQTSIRTEEQKALQYADNAQRVAATRKFEIEKETQAYVEERLRLARAEADRFERRLEQYVRLRRDNPQFLASIWYDEIRDLVKKLKANDAIDMLDNHLGADGLDVTVFPNLPKNK